MVIHYLGPPEAVVIICIPIRGNFYTECNWNRPYTIEGVHITGYKFNITQDDKILKKNLTSVNHFTYLSGTYDVSVTAVVGENLEGEVNVTQVRKPTGN